MEKGHEVRHVERDEPAQVKATYNSGQGISEVQMDLVDVQEVRWDKGGTVRAGDYTFFL
jgi:hypothetical protein